MKRLSRLIDLARRAMRKPPRVLLERALSELFAQAERFAAPRLARSFGTNSLLRASGARSLAELWGQLAGRPFLLPQDVDWARVTPAVEVRAIMDRAEAALSRRVSLLGSGTVSLGTPIDWHTDFKTGHCWAPRFHRDIDYNNPDRPSDVKVPWELSRMQWLIPAGQAYLLTGDERYAALVRDVLEEWIAANPYAMSVNWSCTMEAALRLLSWTWFFHAFKASDAWSHEGFRGRFLASLYLHGRFVERHLEKSDVNGNHYTADAAGLVFAGLFFGSRGDAPRWQKLGWQILMDELPRQVTPDGVDYEASVPYHRLVAELFLLPAALRLAVGLDVAPNYRRRVLAMGEFSAAYCRPDGGVPLLGDADDARALPLGVQSINDHRYLVDLIAAVLDDDGLGSRAGEPTGETRWLLGPQPKKPKQANPAPAQTSVAFADGGVYVMANGRDHIFIDCGPVGLASRGGHGHNDCLSFEAVIDGTHLVSDAGAYLYTASYEERNLFRSTRYHNTPRIDEAEINRFIRPDYLWNLHYDAVPSVHEWKTGSQTDMLEASHAGYMRMANPVRPIRRFTLDHLAHRLSVEDRFETEDAAEHTVEIPLLLAPRIEPEILRSGGIILWAGERRFCISWGEVEDWTLSIEDGRVSPSYGVVEPSRRLVWRRTGSLKAFRMSIAPGD